MEDGGVCRWRWWSDVKRQRILTASWSSAGDATVRRSELHVTTSERQTRHGIHGTKRWVEMWVATERRSDTEFIQHLILSYVEMEGWKRLIWQVGSVDSLTLKIWLAGRESCQPLHISPHFISKAPHRGVMSRMNQSRKSIFNRLPIFVQNVVILNPCFFSWFRCSFVWIPVLNQMLRPCAGSPRRLTNGGETAPWHQRGGVTTALTLPRRREGGWTRFNCLSLVREVPRSLSEALGGFAVRAIQRNQTTHSARPRKGQKPKGRLACPTS